MRQVFYILVLYVVGVGLLLIELFVPGGVVGAAGAAALVTSVVLCFNWYGPAWGGVVLLLEIITAGVMFMLWARVFPRSWIGRKMVLRQSEQSNEGYVGSEPELAALTGRSGVSVTDLRPAGMAIIDGHKIDVVTEGAYVQKGVSVRVIETDGNRVVVRVAEDAKSDAPTQGRT